jgi:hypothetical protein
MPRLTSLALLAFAAAPAPAQLIDKPNALAAQTFWDNRDFDWYASNIPFFDCPDPDLVTTYYYRWELVTKHLTYGSPASGYSFTEFIDRPFWSGAYGAISCPAGLQLYEVRWLRDPRYARDYARYWVRTPGAQPRRYSTWLADAAWAVHQVHPSENFLRDVYPGLAANHAGWANRHFVPAVGLFWQTGHDDGMEYNINSRQTRDPNAGGPGYRPTLNSYLWADSLALARMSELAGDKKAAGFREQAAAIKSNLQTKLWDAKRQFFFHMAKQDESADGFTVKALSLTHQTGKHAGDPHGRELIGYVPWQFNLPDAGKGYEVAWKKLLAADGFAAPFGPTTVERNDPMFALKKTCCWWSGQSWPYATAQTLKAMANLLQNYKQDAVTPADYLKLLTAYAKTHRKDGNPYIAEACHPDTGSWAGHDTYNHSEHYFHSNYCDLIITGLAGLKCRDDDTLEVHPLAPADWPYFAVEDIPYRGRLIGIVWDKDGTRYGVGAGLHLLSFGKVFATSAALGKLSAPLPGRVLRGEFPTLLNFAVNNDGGYYPKPIASVGNPQPLVDGNYWYHRDPPNRWTCEGSPTATDWCGVEFGIPRQVSHVSLYFLDDDAGPVRAPAAYQLEYRDGDGWKPVPGQTRWPEQPTGRRANTVRFPELTTPALRAVLTHRDGSRSGLTEFEAWGPGSLPVAAAPMPAGNLAHNPAGQGFPKATASFTFPRDRAGRAIDGTINFHPEPSNRWTAYDSPNAEDWLAVDFGKPVTVGRLELGLYDDRGGVRPPARYRVQAWDGERWADVANPVMSPETPAGGRFNEVRFTPVMTSRVRVVFTHAGQAKSGVTELLAFEK